jgi:Icc-related predicted phosphoesterase
MFYTPKLRAQLQTDNNPPVKKRRRPLIKGTEVLLEYEDGKITASNLSLLAAHTTLNRRPKTLRVIAFSDYRTQDIHELVEHAAVRKPDVLLYGGDDLNRFHCGGENLLERLASHAKYGLCAVAGNDDIDGTAQIKGDGVYPVHRNALVIGPFAVVGLEGAPSFPPGFGERMNIGHLLYPNFVTSHQIRRWDVFRDKVLIIVSHAPPFGTLDMAMRFGTRRIGNQLLRDYILNNRNAAVCVCGHVHSRGGCSESLGQCTVVNAASHDGKRDVGKIAELSISTDGAVGQIEVLAQFWCRAWAVGSDSGSRRARSNSTPVRPYIWRFSTLSRLMCPSTGPLLHGVVTAASTALRSCFNVRTKRSSA